MAQFQKGHPKIGGRKKGVPNKKKLKKVAELLAEANIHPVEAAIDLIQNGEMKDADRARLWLEIHSYCEVKPKENEDAPVDDLTEDQAPTEALLTLVKNSTQAGE